MEQKTIFAIIIAVVVISAFILFVLCPTCTGLTLEDTNNDGICCKII